MEHGDNQQGYISINTNYCVVCLCSYAESGYYHLFLYPLFLYTRNQFFSFLSFRDFLDSSGESVCHKGDVFHQMWMPLTRTPARIIFVTFTNGFSLTLCFIRKLQTMHMPQEVFCEFHGTAISANWESYQRAPCNSEWSSQTGARDSNR